MNEIKAYENCVREAKSFLDTLLTKQNSFHERKVDLQSDTTRWPDGGNNQMLFQADTAYELGGGGKPGVGGLLLTDDNTIVPEDEIVLIGPDLGDIHGAIAYARLAFVLVDEAELGEGKDAYQNIRKIEYARYRVNPEGYMVRISAMNHKEAVRVGKQALQKGMRFADVGKLYLDEYHKHPAVKAVKLVFVTTPNANYCDLAKIVSKSEGITQTLDHLLTKVNMDCDSCGLKVICDEVEDMIGEKAE